MVDRLTGATRSAEAITCARELLGTPGLQAETAARLRLKLSSILAAAGRSSEAVDEADAVVAERGLSDDLSMAAEVHRLIGLVTLGDLPTARTHAEAILAGSAGPGGDIGLAGALTVIALSAWTDGRAAEAMRLFGAAMRRAELGAPELRCLNSCLGRTVALAALGDFDAADADVARVHDEIARNGDRFWAAAPATLGAVVDLAAGRLDRAATNARAGRAMSEVTGTTFFRASADWVLGTVALHAGDLVEAAVRVSSYQGAVRPFSGGLSEGAYIWLAARVADAQGRPDLALGILSRILDHVSDHHRLLVDEPTAAPWLVRAALAAGEQRQAESVVLCAEQLTEASPGLPSLCAAATHARGLLEREPARCVWAAESHRHPWAKASAHEDAAVLLVEAGDRWEGGHQLDAAHATYERAAAARDATRVSVRRRGIRGMRRRRSDRPVIGWASLTDAERRVARLVAEGQTNVQAAAHLDLSRHTVGFHLRQIYRKLDIGSRVELARIVATRPNRPTRPTGPTAR